MDVKKSTAPLTSPTPHDLETIIDIIISRTPFFIFRYHSTLIIHTSISISFGQVDFYLREDQAVMSKEV